MNGRYEELDSLRGLAASSVLLSHLVIPGVYLFDKLKNTPFHIFWAGHEAVILFFVLSGFVLSLPYYNNRAPRYGNYLTRRICRIYIPYIVSIIFSILLMLAFPRLPLPELNNWSNDTWTNSLTSGLFFDHVIFLGEFKSEAFNPVVWSLVHEMRISLIFPFLIYFVLRLDWKKNIIFALGCTALYYLMIKILNSNIPYIYSIHYIAFFTIGALLAKHRQFIHQLCGLLPKSLKVTIAVIGIMAYTYNWWFLPNSTRLHITLINDWFVAIGGAIFIIFSLNSKHFKKVLLFKPVHFVGKISYSLYLFHMPVLLSIINILHGKLPIGLLLGSSFILSFVVASGMYYLIEKPSISLGKYLTKPKIAKQNDQNMIKQSA